MRWSPTARHPSGTRTQLVGKVQWLEADRGGRIPAAALTAYSRTDERVRQMLDAVQRELPKPVEPSLLAAEIARLDRTRAPPRRAHPLSLMAIESHGGGFLRVWKCSGRRAHARVWAPACRSIDVIVERAVGRISRTTPLRPRTAMATSPVLIDAAAGDRYWFELDGEPAAPGSGIALSNQTVPHGPSAIVDPVAISSGPIADWQRPAAGGSGPL